ncbi:MAG: Spy/CpxP family protein refolding chaperone [Caldimicrobium sp.]|jgi:hypothetical protein
MKKLFKGLVLLGLIGGFTHSAYAGKGGCCPWGGFGMSMGGFGMSMANVSGINYEKVKKFYEETKDLRQKLWETREALRGLYLSSNPDWKAIAEKRAEMAKIMTELQEKAAKEGIPFALGIGMRGWGVGRGMMLNY